MSTVTLNVKDIPLQFLYYNNAVPEGDQSAGWYTWSTMLSNSCDA